MVSNTVYHFVDSNLGVVISSKKGVNRKIWRVLKVVFPRRGGNNLPLGRKGLPRGPGVEGSYTY